MSSVVAEIPGFLQIFSDDTVKRVLPEVAPTSQVFSNGYKSKDVVINPLKPIGSRIFVPQTAGGESTQHLLPVVLYFHGGGFCFASTTWLGYHHFLGSLCTKSQCIVISVEYRLAPEHRIPAAYDDCFESLLWLGSKGKSDAWLMQADLNRVFLLGDSAGANIAYHVLLRSLTYPGEQLATLRGVSLIHPYFGTEARLDCETALDEAVKEAVKISDNLWRLSLPLGSNRDHFACNFETEPATGFSAAVENWSGFPPVVVHVAGQDLLKERGVKYAEFLQKKGVKSVEVVAEEAEPHVFFLFHPESEATGRLHAKLYQLVHRVDGP